MPDDMMSQTRSTTRCFASTFVYMFTSNLTCSLPPTLSTDKK